MGNEIKKPEYILGFDRTAVPGEGIKVIAKKAQTIFQIERIIIPSEVGVDFVVLDVKIGDKSQLLDPSQQGVEIPAVVFSETALGVKLKMDTANIDDEISITVKNLNPAQRDFACTVVGSIEKTAEEKLADEKPRRRLPNKPTRSPRVVLNPGIPIPEMDNFDEDMGLPSIEIQEKKSPWEVLGGRLLRIVDKSLGLFETGVGIVAERLEGPESSANVTSDNSFKKEYVLGFDMTEIPPDQIISVVKRPQVVFRPERVVIPSEIGKNFMIVDIKVGRNSQFIASGDVPGITFSEQAFGVRLKMDVCQISMDVLLVVRNITSEPKNFTVAIIGPAIEMWSPLSRRKNLADKTIYS